MIIFDARLALLMIDARRVINDRCTPLSSRASANTLLTEALAGARARFFHAIFI